MSLWRELRQISTTEGGNTVHCYLIWDEVTRDAALFDTGWDAAPVFKLIEENQLQLKHLFITHTHEDHVAGLQPIRERFPKIHLHTDARGAPPQHRNRRNDFIMLGSLRITNRETPGHAEDGVTYIIGNVAGGRAARGDRGRCDFRRLNRARQPVVGFGEAKSARTNFHAAGGDVDLPRPRPADDGGGGKGTQPVLLIGNFTVVDILGAKITLGVRQCFCKPG